MTLTLPQTMKETRSRLSNRVMRLLHGKYKDSPAPRKAVAAEMAEDLTAAGVDPADHLIAVINLESRNGLFEWISIIQHQEMRGYPTDNRQITELRRRADEFLAEQSELNKSVDGKCVKHYFWPTKTLRPGPNGKLRKWSCRCGREEWWLDD